MQLRYINLVLLVIFGLALPLISNAGVSLKGNEPCIISKCDTGPGTPKCFTIKCQDKGAEGRCETATKCKGLKYTDQAGQSKGVGDAGGFQEIMKQAMGMLQQLMQAKQQKQQQPPPPPPPPSGGGGAGGPEGCAQYYQVTAPSTDKCAYYVPPTSSSLLQSTGVGGAGLSGSDELLNALNAGEGQALNVSDTLLGPSGSLPAETQAGASTPSPASAEPTSTPAGPGFSGQQVNLQSGTRGDIVVMEGGATIVAQARDAGANTEVAGFYGSSGAGGQPQGIISGMCQSRPWGTSIVSFVIPPAFFDSLCAWRGFQVGSPAPPSAPVVEKSATKPAPAPAPTPAPPAETVPPQVDIWVVPDKVPLGTRTSVFWNTKGVESCSITSPDGSFNENSLSGGAATVPLSGATTFTISCLTAGGTPVTDYVTVQLAI